MGSFHFPWIGNRYCWICKGFALLFCVLWSINGVNAQPGLPPYQASKVADILSSARGKSADVKIKALTDAAHIMRTYMGESDDTKLGTAILEYERNRLEVYSESFRNVAKIATQSDDPKARDAAMRKLRVSLLRPSTNAILLMAQDGITNDEAREILKIAKAISQIVDDVKNMPEFGENSQLTGPASPVTQALKMAKGAIDLVDGARDQDATELVSGIRNTFGAIDAKWIGSGTKGVNPIKVFEPALRTAGAQIEVTREMTVASIDVLALASKDTPESRHKLAAAIERLQNTPKQYGRKMQEALLGTISDKIPYLRSLKDLDGESISDLSGRWTYGGSGRAIILQTDGQIQITATWGASATPHYKIYVTLTGNTLIGEWVHLSENPRVKRLFRAVMSPDRKSFEVKGTDSHGQYWNGLVFTRR